MQANMHEAKSKLSQLVDSALSGEEVIIAKAGKPAVRLIPVEQEHKRTAGRLKGQIIINDEFDSLQVNKQIAEEFDI